jgi:hypothetical protein
MLQSSALSGEMLRGAHITSYAEVELRPATWAINRLLGDVAGLGCDKRGGLQKNLILDSFGKPDAMPTHRYRPANFPETRFWTTSETLYSPASGPIPTEGPLSRVMADPYIWNRRNEIEPIGWGQSGTKRIDDTSEFWLSAVGQVPQSPFLARLGRLCYLLARLMRFSDMAGLKADVTEG